MNLILSSLFREALGGRGGLLLSIAVESYGGPVLPIPRWPECSVSATEAPPASTLFWIPNLTILVFYLILLKHIL